MKLFFMIWLTAFLSLGLFSMTSADDILSLRGSLSVDQLSSIPARAKVILFDEGNFERSFPKQPPLIPHPVMKTRISLLKNQCLGCHGELEYKDIEAPKVSDTHFINRKNEELGHVSTRYYFCTQCHVAQINKTPLVENEF